MLNRPHSVSLYIRKGGLRAMAEEYVYIAETDHVLLKPLPNLAAEESAYGYGFWYMKSNVGVTKVLAALADEFPALRDLQYSQVQTIGPSPVIIAKVGALPLPSRAPRLIAPRRDIRSARLFALGPRYTTTRHRSRRSRRCGSTSRSR